MLQTPIIIENNIDDLYKAAINDVLLNGFQVEARGLKFKEVLFSHLVLTNPRARIVQNPLRKISKKFMIAEFIWIMSGQNGLDMIGHYSKNYAQFSDNGLTLRGAYGPRLRRWNVEGYTTAVYDQLQGILDKLQKDLGSRQAVIVILNPGIDFIGETKDVPCNDLLQFFVRDNKLHMSCYVRSNDLNWGFPYDVHAWTLLQEIFANILKVELGDYHHFCGSLHIYNKDINIMKKCLDEGVKHVPVVPMPPVEDLSIFNTLSNIEKNFRRTGVLCVDEVPNFWAQYLSYLKL